MAWEIGQLSPYDPKYVWSGEKWVTGLEALKILKPIKQAKAQGRYNRYNTNNTRQSAFVQSLNQSPFANYTDPIISTNNQKTNNAQESDFIKSERERLAKKLSIGTVVKPRVSVVQRPRIDWGARFNSAIGALSDEDKNYLTGLGLDLSSARALLSSINSKGLGNLAEDNQWYTKSQEALDYILNDYRNNQTRSNQILQMVSNWTPNITFNTPQQTVLQPEVTSNDIYDHTFNKRQTKQWLRDRGVDTRGLGRRTIRTWRDMLNNKDPWVEKFDAANRPTNNTVQTSGQTSTWTMPALKTVDYNQLMLDGWKYTPTAKKGSKLIKKEEVCPKCGKVHKAGIGCTLAKFYARGGKKD